MLAPKLAAFLSCCSQLCTLLQIHSAISLIIFQNQIHSSENNSQVVGFSILTWHPSNKIWLSSIMGHQSLPSIKRSPPPPPPPPCSLGKILMNSGRRTCPKSNKCSSCSCPSFKSTLRMTITPKTCHTPQRNKKNHIVVTFVIIESVKMRTILCIVTEGACD